MNPYRFAAAAIVAVLAGSAAQAHDEIIIGRTAAGRLAVHLHVPLPFVLAPSEFVDFPGWTDIEPAIVSAATDDPEEDLFVADSRSNIKFVIEDFGPQIRLLSDDGSHWVVPGETYQLGSPFFHIHPIWNLPPDTEAGVYEMRLHLTDTTGRYTDSETYTFTFVRRCPADLNADGLIDFADYLEFLNFYDAGDSTVDFNNDGLVDFSDYLEFLNFYDGGC